MAECMGLHRDGSTYGLSPLETEIRRMVWHQLCFLDIRTCEAQGPKPAIRREDYDTKLPLNCDQDELTPQTTVSPPPAEKWTPALLSIMRFEINEMMRIIWQDRRKVENQKITLTTMLERVENFRKKMLAKYGPMLNDRTPIQQYAKLVMQLLIYRLHVMVLHPYHSNTANPLPDKLSGLLVTSGVFIIEIAMRLESNPLFRNWMWYSGAYHQYHVAMLLTAEVYYKPNHRLVERIWPCLDWVFDVDPNLPREQKVVQILSDMVAKTNIYMSLRKVRAPTGINKAVPDKYAVKESPPPTANPQPPKAPPRASQPRASQPQTSQPHTSQSQIVQQHQHQQHPVSQHPPQQHATQHQPSQPHTTQPSAISHPYPQPSHPGAAPMGLPPAPTEVVVSTAGMPASIPPPQALPGAMNAHLPAQTMGMGMQMVPQQQPPPPPPPQNLMYHPSPHQMIYAGVTNGEVLWSLPPGPTSAGSPGNSSDAGSVATQPQPQPSHAAGMAGPPPSASAPVPTGGIMESLDWSVLNELFETDPTTGQFSFNTFVDLGFGGFSQSGTW
ncbi:hypothetical protein VTI74DRAFT_2181 [Chaetomium olivicolor]